MSIDYSEFAFPKGRPKVLVKADAKKANEKAALALRKAIRARDKDRCRCCRKPCSWDAVDPLTRAHVHHLVFRSASKKLQDSPSNLLTLCGKCHHKIHAHEILVVGEDATQTVTFTKVKKAR